MDNYGCLQGARLLGMGTLIFSQNHAKGTFIREGTFIRQGIVLILTKHAGAKKPVCYYGISVNFQLRGHPERTSESRGRGGSPKWAK